jgi:hypothetical protein
MTPEDRLPELLDSLWISIDARGELALRGRRPQLGFGGRPASVIADSSGRRCLLFEPAAPPARSARPIRPRARGLRAFSSALLVVAAAVTAAAVLVTVCALTMYLSGT